MKSLTGQYECANKSGLGLDYFTAKLHRLTLYSSGRFTLITQEKSRIMHAAKSLVAGEQATMEAPETHREGHYSELNDVVLFHFDDGTEEQAQLQADGLQIGKDYYEKVAESTFMPPPQRMKSNMEDIAKGLKIAGAIGGTVLKAARTIQDTLQTQPPQNNQPSTSGSAQQAAPATPPPVNYTPPQGPQGDETLFCDQCGARVRLGKRFCNQCGARLP
jgi:zinc ribbon protein